jgi:phosphoserine aminotransferase
VVASSEDKNFNYIPRGFEIPTDADYFHITTNNTIFGTEILHQIESPIPLVADMSSDIFSRVIDVSKYALIYGGAQKNLAPAGVTFVIIKNDILGKVDRKIPTMLNYKTHIEKESMFNTPPVVPIYAALQTLKWLKNMGGIAEMEKINIRKADLLYNEIDRNPLFRATVPAKEDRSRMNVCFVMTEAFVQYEKEFDAFASSRGMVGLQGHRDVGGFRASIYNALPYESVEALVSVMQEFENMKK